MQQTLPLVYPPTRLNIKDRSIRPCSAHATSALYNTPPKWPNTLPSYAKLPHQAAEPLKVFGNPTPPKRPNTLPSRVKLPPQAVKKLKVFGSNQNFPSDVKLPSQAVNMKVYTAQTSERPSSRIVINDWEQRLRNGAQPSRQRHLPAILAATAAGAQRSGATWPSFLPRGLTPGMALDVSRNIGPFRRALDLASSPQDKCNFRRIDESPKVAKSNRHRVIRELTSLAAKLKPLQVNLQGKLKPLAPARCLHIPLIASW